MLGFREAGVGWKIWNIEGTPLWGSSLPFSIGPWLASLANVLGVFQRLRYWGPLVLSVMYAVSDEWHQTFVPTRVGTPWDVMIDGAGAALGLALAGLWWRWRRPG